MYREEFSFANSSGLELASRLYYKKDMSKNGVIFSHGLFSSKDGYKITNMAEEIVSAGYTLMTFDFTYAGDSRANIADISISQEVDDLIRGVEAFKKRGVEKIHLMGSSMGGVVSILAASQGVFSYESLILIATPVDLSGLIPEKADNNDESEMVSLSGVNVKKSFIDELRNLNVASAAEKIKSPVLIIHGMLDKVVSLQNFEELKRVLSVPIEPVLIEEGDHNLTEDSHLIIIKDKVKSWLGKFTV